MNVLVFIERRCSDSPHRPVIVMVSFGTRWEIWRTYSSDFDCRQSKPFEKMDWGESRSPNRSCRHCRWPLSSDVVVRCVGVQICVSVSMFPRGDHPLYHWWLRMSRQIYNRTWMPHVEQLEYNIHPSIHLSIQDVSPLTFFRHRPFSNQIRFVSDENDRNMTFDDRLMVDQFLFTDIFDQLDCCLKRLTVGYGIDNDVGITDDIRFDLSEAKEKTDSTGFPEGETSTHEIDINGDDMKPRFDAIEHNGDSIVRVVVCNGEERQQKVRSGCSLHLQISASVWKLVRSLNRI